MAFSPNGRYLCSSGTDKTIRVWDSTSRRVIERIEDTVEQVSDLAWRPGAGSNSISFVDNQGFVSRWHDVIPLEHAHPNDAPPAGAKGASAVEAQSKKKNTSHELDDDDLDLGFGDDAAAVNSRSARTDGDVTDEDDFIEDDEDDGVYQSRYGKVGSLPPPLAAHGRSSVVVATSSASKSCEYLLRVD